MYSVEDITQMSVFFKHIWRTIISSSFVLKSNYTRVHSKEKKIWSQKTYGVFFLVRYITLQNLDMFGRGYWNEIGRQIMSYCFYEKKKNYYYCKFQPFHTNHPEWMSIEEFSYGIFSLSISQTYLYGKFYNVGRFGRVNKNIRIFFYLKFGSFNIYSYVKW